jgi:thiol-disulfide isomerase/thioredoxin
MTRDELARFERTQREVIDVATALIGLPVDESTQLQAAEGKLQALGILAQLGIPQADKDFQAYLTELSQSKSPELAKLGRRMAFAQQMDSFSNGEQMDPAKLLKDFQNLFADEQKDAALFALGNQVARIFMQQDKNQEGLAAMRLTHAAFATHADPQVANQAKSLGEEIKMVELDFNSKLGAFLREEPNSEPALFGAIDELFASPNVGQTSLSVMLQVAQILESRSMEAAAKVYAKIQQEVTKFPQFAEEVTETIESFGKRRALIGQPFVVEGVTLEGSPFDWSKYQGKVVLVDFWATWCRPCLEEMPNIRRNYDQYHDQGFEVVGINLDDNRQQVDQFFALQKFPWATVLSPDPNNVGFDHPLAVKCGLKAIPFLVLVDRDGKAIALNLRGDQLGRKLEELFTSGAKTRGTAPPASKGAKTSGLAPRRSGGTATSFVTAATAPEKIDRSGRIGPGNEESIDRAVRMALSVAGARRQEIATSPDLESAVAALDEPQAKAGPAGDDDSNPYLASPGLKTDELVDFILEMQDKPQSIQNRPGFALAIADAADRVLAGQAQDKHQRLAIAAKFSFLHRAAVAGDAKAEKLLDEFVERCRSDEREEVVREVRFFRTERAAVTASQLPPEKIPQVLEEIRAYLERETLTQRHLRMASSIVEAINRVEDDVYRETRFMEFGKLFAKSQSKDLARYGNRLAETPQSGLGEWVGKPLELAGTTLLGTPFNLGTYRGKVVMIDLWASWCGPCLAEMPALKELQEKLSSKGFDVVGVNLDKDPHALEKYLAENTLPWANVAGQEAMEFARRIGVRGIPAMLLTDREGKVVAVGSSVAELSKRAESMLASAAN